jgi:nucleoside phosphorylase
MKYKEYKIKDLNKVISEGVVLIVTATDIESESTHKRLVPINGFDTILQVYDDAYTYYFGKFGKYNIAHVQSNMGAVGRDSAIMTISRAISSITPRFVIMIGIAFGVNSEKQNIGDVLISEGIIPYDNTRIGKETLYR